MPLPAPDLDDRGFQDLVDEAKRLVMRRCPEWTDHNVSDPGVTLIETFAYMTDQLIYRVNRIPDRLYCAFLDLIGLRLLPPTPARVPVTFWLSAPAATPLRVTAGTEVGTVRTTSVESVVFSTREDLVVVPCSLDRVRTPPRDGEAADDGAAGGGTGGGEGTVDRTRQLAQGRPFPAFRPMPALGDTLLIGLSAPVPGCAVRLDVRARVEGVGVNPEHPPLLWEAWTGTDWTECERGTDGTGGLNSSGAIVLHIPAGHAASVIGGERAAWIRGRVVEPLEGQPPYTASPVIDALTACTIGGTVEAMHAEIVRDEVLGEAEGVPGQQFELRRGPVLTGFETPVVQTASDGGWREWTAVTHFAASGPEDRHFLLDPVSRLLVFGPAVREADGSLRQYGAVPSKGARVRVRRYAIGGGAGGNVGAGALRTLKSSIPFVAAVENRRSAQGGTDGESLEEAKRRGPLLLRTRDRAVTAEDYEVLAREAAPGIARVRCVPAGSKSSGTSSDTSGGESAGGVRVLVVPAAAVDRDGRVEFESLVPAEPTLAAIAARLDEARVVGARVSVEPPLYRAVTVVARLVARPRVDLERVRRDALRALYAYLNPLPGGGPEGSGWPFGRTVHSGEVYGLLHRVSGVELVEDVRLFSADPVTGERGRQAERIELEPNSLVFSYEHQVRAEAH